MIKGGDEMTLLEIRREMSMSQKEMAHILGKTVSSYSRKEVGTRRLSLEEAKMIAQKYHETTGKYLDITKL